MKKSELKALIREVIKSVVARKLRENNEYNIGMQLSTFVKNKGEFDEFDAIQIQTNLGDEPLEIIKWWIANKILHIGVGAAPNLQELTPAVTSTGAQVNPQAQQDQADQMTDAERTQIQNAQKEQEKLTNDVRRIDGAKQKALEPLRRKIETLDRAKAAKEKKLGSITQKITNIQRKHSKV
jgi:hypothetical protein